MRKWNMVPLLLLLPIIASVSGCLAVAAGAAAGAGGYAYYRGSGEKSYPYDVARVHSAVVEMLKAEGASIYRDEAGSTSARNEATLADGTKIKITMETDGPSVTRVSMRIGFWGDSDRTAYFFEKLDKRLGY